MPVSSDGMRRCKVCGSPLAAANKGDQCFRHQISTTDEEVIGPPPAIHSGQPQQKKQKIGMCEGCGELRIIVALGRCWRCYKRKHRGRPDVLMAAGTGAIAAAPPADLKPADVLAAVNAVFGVTRDELRGGGRTRLLVQARHVAMYLLRSDLALSFPAIGKELLRDHTSAMYGCSKIERELEEDATLAAAVTQIKKRYASS